MKSQLTSRERVLAAMRRQPVDYVPCAPFFNFQDWPQRMGKRWQYPFGPSVPEMLDYAVGTLGLDQVISFALDYYPDQIVTSEVRLEGEVLWKRYRTPAGELQAAVRWDDRWPHGADIPLFSDYNPAHFVEPWIKTRADVDCLGYLLLPPRSKEDLYRARLQFEEAKRLAGRYGVAVYCSCGLGLTGAVNSFGANELCLLAAEDPALVDAYLEVDHRWNLGCLEIALELGVDFIRRNGFYETCDFFSPVMLRQFLGERLQREIALAHAAERPIGYTLLSGYGPMIDHLAALEFDCLICPDVFLRDGDAALLAERLGDRTAFWTGPSDTVHMPWERPNEVRQAVRDVFEAFGKTGLLITPCSSSKAVFPWENVLAMVDEWKEHRRYA